MKMTEEQIRVAREWCEAAPKGPLDMIIGANSRSLATFYTAALAGWPAALDALDEKDAEVARLEPYEDRCAEQETRLGEWAMDANIYKAERDKALAEAKRLKVANTVLGHRVDEAANVVGRLETEVERMGEFIAQVPRHAVAHKYWAALAKTETEGSET